jgi:hypothetical protein
MTTTATNRQWRKKPVVIEAITFDELVAHGIASGATLHNGMPWSFSYAGHPITHENDDCYLIPTLEGTMKMGRDDMLITGVKGEIYPCKCDIFAATYEPASPPTAGAREAPITMWECPTCGTICGAGVTYCEGPDEPHPPVYLVTLYAAANPQRAYGDANIVASHPSGAAVPSEDTALINFMQENNIDCMYTRGEGWLCYNEDGDSIPATGDPTYYSTPREAIDVVRTFLATQGERIR